MKTSLLTATAVALLALTACQSKTETTVTNTTTVENTVTAPIELPPAIMAESTMRCRGDNSLVEVTFFEAKKDGTVSASVQSPQGASPVMVSAAEAGKPLTAEGGWSLSGDAKSIKLAQPGKPEQTCSK